MNKRNQTPAMPPATEQRFSVIICRFRPSLSRYAPDDEQKIRPNTFVVTFTPYRPVDPGGMYVYVMNKEGSFTVMRESLEPVRVHTLIWKRQPYMTAVDELKEELRLTKEYYQQYLDRLFVVVD